MWNQQEIVQMVYIPPSWYVTQEALWILVNVECPKFPYLKYFYQMINEYNITTFIDLIKAGAPPEVACGWTDLC